MPDHLLVRGARQLVTLRGSSGPRRGSALRELSIVADGAVLISDGVIMDVGATRRVENLAAARQAREIDASGRVVLPGLVDCCAHLVAGPLRLEHEARRVLAAMVRHGTTTVEARDGELKPLRVATRLNGSPLDVVRTFLATRFEEDPLSKVHRRKLAEFVDVSCGDGAFLHLEQARRLGFELRVRGSAALAVESGAVSVSGIDGAPPAEVERLAHSNTIAVLTPGTAFHGGGPRSPARAWLDQGVALAIATGYHPAQCPSPSLPMAVALACAELRLTPAEAIAAATINAAHALGCAARRGSLEYFKDGDLILLNAGDYRELPLRFGCNLVHMTVKRGAIIYREGTVA
ncbi:MAG: amidohydrolase family protein [Acidobacteria bacterium]|nr:amidohydrolase family protein [Acidobacteriota bacterium]